MHGCGKCQATIKGANLVKGEGLEPRGVKWELNETEMDWFIEALQMAMAAISDDEPEPEEAINSNESDSWKGGMEEELLQIEKLNTWELVQAPPDANIIPSKWTLHRKHNAQGKIAHY